MCSGAVHVGHVLCTCMLWYESVGPRQAHCMGQQNNIMVVPLCWQAYVGDELGYSETPITQDMRIAIVDVGTVDGADIVSKACSCDPCTCIHCAATAADPADYQGQIAPDFHSRPFHCMVLVIMPACNGEKRFWQGLLSGLSVHAAACAGGGEGQGVQRGRFCRDESAHGQHHQRAGCRGAPIALAEGCPGISKGKRKDVAPSRCLSAHALCGVAGLLNFMYQAALAPCSARAACVRSAVVGSERITPLGHASTFACTCMTGWRPGAAERLLRGRRHLPGRLAAISARQRGAGRDQGRGGCLGAGAGQSNVAVDDWRG